MQWAVGRKLRRGPQCGSVFMPVAERLLLTPEAWTEKIDKTIVCGSFKELGLVPSESYHFIGRRRIH